MPSTMRLISAVLLVLSVLVGHGLSVFGALPCTFDHGLLGFGSGSSGQLGNGGATIYTPDEVYRGGVLAGLNITSTSAGGSHTLVLASTGEVYSFGDNNYGQLGDGSTFDQYYPVPVDSTGVLNGTTITAVSAGNYHSLVLSDNGTVFSFGNNNYGQLGDNSWFNRYTPVAVDTTDQLAGLKITAISAGNYFSLVLAETGRVFSFGRNDQGQLGDGTITTKYVPVAVYTLGLLNTTLIKAISAGGYHSLFLSTSGQVFSCGDNADGQLGDGSISSYSIIPVAVDTSGVLNATTIIAVSAGNSHSLVLSASGKVYSFGDNSNYQLGDGTITDRSSPVAVNTSTVLNQTTIIAISAGGFHSLVLSASGYAYSFGYNYYGQLGDGTSWSASLAVATQMNGYDIIAIDAGNYHSMAISSHLIDIVSGAIRDGSSLGIQDSYQSTMYSVNANWDTFVGMFETGRSRPITSYTFSTFEVETKARILGPNLVTSTGEPIVWISASPWSYLLHNHRYFSVINATMCPAISRISPGFLVDVTPPLVGEVHTMTNLWLVGDNFTFNWNGISDPESGIDYLHLNFRDAKTFNILTQSCTLRTQASSGSANMSWVDCSAGSLPPVNPLFIQVTVYNRAGGSSMISNYTEFQVAGIRITDVINYNGLSTPQFKQCRRAIVEWVSIGLNDTFVMPSLYGTSMLNMSDTPIPIERERFEMEPIPGTLPPSSSYTFVLMSQILYSPPPMAYTNGITIGADDNCIKITSPDESSAWESGTIQTIKWSSTSLTGSITLELLQDSESVALIGTSLVAAHKLNWQVPYNLKENAKFQIRAESLDVSGVVFTTDAIEISVLSAGHRIEFNGAMTLVLALLVNLVIFALAL